MKQHTIKKEVSATGIGVHSGKEVKITLKPAPVSYTHLTLPTKA